MKKYLKIILIAVSALILIAVFASYYLNSVRKENVVESVKFAVLAKQEVREKTTKITSEAKVSTITLFTDPESRFRITIPEGLNYEYDKDSKGITLWQKSDKKLPIFSISYESKESIKGMTMPTEIDKNRTLALKSGQTVIVYDPSITEACHEEAWVKLSDGGALMFYSVCGNDELRPWFNKIIMATEVLK